MNDKRFWEYLTAAYQNRIAHRLGNDAINHWRRNARLHSENINTDDENSGDEAYEDLDESMEEDNDEEEEEEDYEEEEESEEGGDGPLLPTPKRKHTTSTGIPHLREFPKSQYLQNIKRTRLRGT